jgi:excisionase family DNA binding protein
MTLTDRVTRGARHLLTDAADANHPAAAIEAIEHDAEAVDQTTGHDVERREASRAPRARTARRTTSSTSSDGPSSDDPAGSLEGLIRGIVREEIERALESAPATDGLLTVAQAATRLGMSESFVRAAIRDGRLPAQRVGRAVRVRPADVDRLPRRRRTSVTRPATRALQILDGGSR